MRGVGQTGQNGTADIMEGTQNQEGADYNQGDNGNNGQNGPPTNEGGDRNGGEQAIPGTIEYSSSLTQSWQLYSN